MKTSFATETRSASRFTVHMNDSWQRSGLFLFTPQWVTVDCSRPGASTGHRLQAMVITMVMMMKVFFATLGSVALLVPSVLADITVVNNLIVPSQIYDFTYSNTSNVWWRGRNRTMYYCIFRSLWTKDSAPNDYPKQARFTDPFMYSSTKEFLPWQLGKAVSVGIGKIATVRLFGQ